MAALRRQHEEDQKLGLGPPGNSAGAANGNPAEGGRATSHEDAEHKWEPELRYLFWLMDRDSKAAPLKGLQGLIWEEGYASGELKSHVFPDVAHAFQRWHSQSVPIAIFSSGSVLAQRLLFAHTVEGDLTPMIEGYFDTTTGPKRDPASYGAIARAMRREPSEIAFISDVTEELDAASATGMYAFLCIRPGNRPAANGSQYPRIHSFDEMG
jgi:enolase-phosphatase E1